MECSTTSAPSSSGRWRKSSLATEKSALAALVKLEGATYLKVGRQKGGVDYQDHVLLFMHDVCEGADVRDLHGGVARRLSPHLGEMDQVWLCPGEDRRGRGGQSPPPPPSPPYYPSSACSCAVTSRLSLRQLLFRATSVRDGPRRRQRSAETAFLTFLPFNMKYSKAV